MISFLYTGRDTKVTELVYATIYQTSIEKIWMHSIPNGIRAIRNAKGPFLEMNERSLYIYIYIYIYTFVTLLTESVKHTKCTSAVRGPSSNVCHEYDTKISLRFLNVGLYKVFLYYHFIQFHLPRKGHIRG